MVLSDLLASEYKIMPLVHTMTPQHLSDLYLDLLETKPIVDNIEIPIIFNIYSILINYYKLCTSVKYKLLINYSLLFK